MAISAGNLFSFLVLVSILCHGSFAEVFGQEGVQEPLESERRFGFQGRQCRLERLSSLEPLRRVQSEAGFTEYFEESHEQLQYAGVAVLRRTVEPRGLLLPYYSNAPRLVYIIKGRGIGGTIFPGCPESYQSFQQSEEQYHEGATEQSRRRRDEHQKIYQVRQGDVIALPAGVVHWFYNDGDSPTVAITVFDTNSNANQLGSRHREFLLAGGGQRAEQSTRLEERVQNNNIFSGFNLDLLAEALGVDRELARKIQGQDERRGEIVRLQRGLQVMRPLRSEQREEMEEETSVQEERRTCQTNGLEESYCFMRNKENIENPTLADVYNPRGGRITSLNSQKLPMLRFVQMSAERGVLHRNAIYAPHWNINAHSIVYVLRGSCRMQVVGDQGRNVFDGELRQGQLILVPQNFAVIKRAQSEHFEWISFKTNHNAMVNQIVGKASAVRGIPLDVLANSYHISREEARALKFNRANEMTVFTPRFEGRKV